MEYGRVAVAVASLAIVLASCGDDAAPRPSLEAPNIVGEIVSDPVDGDDCTQGGAFESDVEFRQAVCRPYLAMVDVIGNGEVDPEWNGRITAAILDYTADRAGALEELRAVLAEIEAAAG